MLTAIGDVMRQLYTRGWITTRDGNVSLRKKGSKVLYITPSGWRKTIIHPEHVVKLKFSDDFSNLTWFKNENSKPSGELHMHFLLQKDAKTCRAIVHAHPTHVVAALFAGWDLVKICKMFPEISRYTKVAPTVPFLPAISHQLGLATWASLSNNDYEVAAEKIDDQGNIKYCVDLKNPNSINNDLVFDIVGQDKHGVCAIAENPWSAYEHIERLDHICEIVLKSGVKPI
jgi:L-fuculose-phosphate aldolase